MIDEKNKRLIPAKLLQSCRETRKLQDDHLKLLDELERDPALRDAKLLSEKIKSLKLKITEEKLSAYKTEKPKTVTEVDVLSEKLSRIRDHENALAEYEKKFAGHSKHIDDVNDELSAIVEARDSMFQKEWTKYENELQDSLLSEINACTEIVKSLIKFSKTLAQSYCAAFELHGKASSYLNGNKPIDKVSQLLRCSPGIAARDIDTRIEPNLEQGIRRSLQERILRHSLKRGFIDSKHVFQYLIDVTDKALYFDELSRTKNK